MLSEAAPACLPTSVARNMLGRMRKTHEKARIAIFTGPPGIGKSTSIRALRAECPDEVAIITIKDRNASAVLALRHMLRALSQLIGNGDGPSPQSESSRLAFQIQFALEVWRNQHFNGARLTLIFDEAQNLSRGAIETLRFYNDAAGDDMPFPVGLIFVGNHELSLKVDDKGQSTISAAVSSRAFYKIEFDVTKPVLEADYRLLLEDAGVMDAAAVDLIVRYFTRPRVPRDLRQLRQLIEELREEADDDPITVETVNSVLSLV